MYSNYRQQPQYDETTALGILQHLDTEELQRLLDDDEKLMDLINDLQQVQQKLWESGTTKWYQLRLILWCILTRAW